MKDFLTMKNEQWWYGVEGNIFYKNVSRSVSFLEEIEIMQPKNDSSNGFSSDG